MSVNTNEFRNKVRKNMNQNVLVESVIVETPKEVFSPKEEYRRKLNETFKSFAIPPANPSDAVDKIEERENPISVETLRGTVKKLGPKGLGETVAGLSTEMNKVDKTGAPASEYSMFVDSIKQDGLEILTAGNVTPSSVGMNVPTEPQAPQPVTGATPAPVDGADDLNSLVVPGQK